MSGSDRLKVFYCNCPEAESENVDSYYWTSWKQMDLVTLNEFGIMAGTGRLTGRLLQESAPEMECSIHH